MVREKEGNVRDEHTRGISSDSGRGQRGGHEVEGVI